MNEGPFYSFECCVLKQFMTLYALHELYLILYFQEL